MIERLEYYEIDSLQKIVLRAAGILNTKINDQSALEISKRSRGTPRIANRLLKRVRDWAQVHGTGEITENIINQSLDAMGVDLYGLDDIDRKYLKTIIQKFNGGPVGIETISASISEETDSLEDVVEPYLLQLGFIERTLRGRMATARAYQHLKITPPTIEKQSVLF
jgi:Holliday junction DNA helicase RuvB